MNKNIGPDHNRFVHGMSRTPTYKSWAEMKRRCYSASCADFKNYGARGIQVCERWHEFSNFFEDMGERPTGLSIERIDNDANYDPGNCVWADRTTQSRNRRFVHLDKATAAAIRLGRESGKTYDALSREFGISISHAHRIASGDAWA
ncbi:hypothetical protein [Roseibium sp.]|uniref:hypothetical protein n=1 Tax=Roseibium sp. TaxID=1936156 RepID=UPI0032743891